jgi:hypothetical protein
LKGRTAVTVLSFAMTVKTNGTNRYGDERVTNNFLEDPLS